MGFNYLQTDDRDDYFATLGRKRNRRKPNSYSLINLEGVMILENVASFKIRSYAKKMYLKHGQSGKYIWRKLLEDKGYKVINNYEAIR